MSSQTRPAGRRWADLGTTAEYLGDTERHIRELVALRQIPHTKLGSKLRFDLDQVDAWLDERARAVVA